jgi:hypothetical protein
MITRMPTLSLLTAAAILIAACSDITVPTGELQNMQGTITEVRTEEIGEHAIAKILIEEDPSVPLALYLATPGPPYAKVLWTLTTETELFRQEEDETLVPIELDELQVGSEVRAFRLSTFNVYVDTGLPIAYAGRVILIEPAS